MTKIQRLDKLRHLSFSMNIIVTMGSNIGMTAIGIVTGSIVSRMLGPEGRGEFAAVQNWPALLVTLGALGIPQAVTYFSGRDPAVAGRTAGTALSLLLFLSIPLIALGYILIPFVLSAQSTQTILIARMYLIMIPLQFLTGIPINCVQGKSEIVAWNVLRFIPVLGWFAVVVLVTIFSDVTPFALSVGHLLFTAISIVPIWWVARYLIKGPYWPDQKRIIPLMRFGIPAALANIPLVLNLRVDQLLMAALLPSDVLGFYAVAVTWSAGVSLLLASVASVTFPRLAAISSASERAKSFGKTLRVSTALSGCLVILALMATFPTMLVLFGPAYTPAIPAALVLVVASGVAGLNHIFEDGLRGAGSPERVLYAELIGLASTFVLLALLLKQYQLMGAAVASLTSYLVVAVSLTIFASRVFGLTLREMLVPRRQELVGFWERLRVSVLQRGQS